MFIGDYYFEFPTSFPQLGATSFWYVAFLFLVFLLARPFRSILRPYILLIANVVFLYSFSVKALIYVAAAALYSYLFGLLLGKFKKKWLLWIGILPVIGLLVFMKYAGLFHWKDGVVMPLGLSFYSFKIISYLADVCNGKIPSQKNPIYYFDYVLFFPSITAGPIHRAKEFFEEVNKREEFDYRDSKNGGAQMMLGIFEKMVFCDFIASVVNRIFDNPELTGMNILLGVVLYAFQIYLDFDSYSNIAIGSARVLGIHLKKNFNSPYLGRNLKEFWARWHISLSTWLRDYIYIPLGGNRRGKILQYVNVLVVFLVSGIWHGSTLNFLLWGLFHGLLRVLEDLILLPFKGKKFPKPVVFLFSIIGIVLNFAIVTALWLIFRYETMGEVMHVIDLIRAGGALNFEAIGLTHNEVLWLGAVLAITIVLDILRNYFDMIDVLSRQFILVRWLFYALVIVIFLIFGVYGGSFDASDFIYQSF